MTKDRKLKVGKHEFDLSPEVPEAKQEWRRHLIVVATGPSRLVGLVENPTAVTGPYKQPTSFMLHYALAYFAHFQFIPVGDPPRPGLPPPVQPIVHPQFIAPYDMLGAIHTRIVEWAHTLVVAEQEPRIQDFFFTGYQHIFAPSMLVRPAQDDPLLKTVVAP